MELHFLSDTPETLNRGMLINRSLIHWPVLTFPGEWETLIYIILWPRSEGRHFREEGEVVAELSIMPLYLLCALFQQGHISTTTHSTGSVPTADSEQVCIA